MIKPDDLPVKLEKDKHTEHSGKLCSAPLIDLVAIRPIVFVRGIK